MDWFVAEETIHFIEDDNVRMRHSMRASTPVINHLFEQAPDKIAQYNTLCLHYNLVADGVYAKRRDMSDPSGPAFEPYLIAALLAFDMGRMMGSGLRNRYDYKAGGFATRLYALLAHIRPTLAPLMHEQITTIDLERHADAIRTVYDLLATSGDGRLGAHPTTFHVGATKLLHLLNPELFLIVDSNAARALRSAYGIPYETSGRPGYSADRYLDALRAVQQAIVAYGPDAFATLERGTPLTRIFDKIAFTSGMKADAPGVDELIGSVVYSNS